MNIFHLRITLILIVVFMGNDFIQAESSKKGIVENTVTPVLKTNEIVLELLNNLKPGESIFLPKFKVIGDFNEVAKKHHLDKNGPGHRNWCNKMVWMSDRKRAFYCGANHGVPHRLNDAWEYDLGSNTWVMLYAPDLSKGGGKTSQWKDVIIKDGIPQTKRGGPAMLGHVWGALTYHEKQKRMYFFSYWGYQPKDWKPKLWKAFKKPFHYPMWSFDCYAKKWIPMPNPVSLPDKGRVEASAVLEYIADTNNIFFKYKKVSFLFDAEQNKYTQMKPNEHLPSAEAVYAYDSKNKILVAHLGGYRYFKKKPTTWEYELKNKTWKKIMASDELPRAHDGMSVFVYDPKTERCLLFRTKFQENPVDPNIWSYDAKLKEWKKHKVKGELPKKSPMGYYDPTYGVFVIHCGQSSKARIWVYRPKE